MADTGTPDSTVTWAGPMSRMRVNFSVDKTVSPTGVAPPVRDDCAPTGRIVRDARTIAGISSTVRGIATDGVWPPGTGAESERYRASIAGTSTDCRL